VALVGCSQGRFEPAPALKKFDGDETDVQCGAWLWYY